ncbi:substrate-binding domain-containing protein [Desulfovibrio sp. JC022]|uniref:substrate-binding domain-containing protein n=1 Tax=Desulfovibrio sp. JC022 TaxID=2593642 RepID=UPI0013D4DA67|nr:substrate-binding domain-containing protein [Desulfovibrio sp. JC022]NDV22577.1 tungsten ABC transporter substrate-binding protein [Desulfovibrio sp. JC022]
MKKLKVLLLAFALVSLLVAPGLVKAETLMMATTTSTDNTGLLDELAPMFKKDTGIELKWTAVGTGKALKMGQNCDVDVLMVHAPAAEKKYVGMGALKDRREVMYNDFVIIGPDSDPAGVKGLPVVQAMKAIADSKAAFVSRGDNSGTNKKEISLWKVAGMAVPDKAKWYIQTGQGMIKSITVAEERDAYIMTDRGTFIKYSANKNGSPELNVLVEGDKSLFNQYSVLAVDPANCKNAKYELATKFSEWMASPKTQKAIGNFKLLGKKLFIPNAK